MSRSDTREALIARVDALSTRRTDLRAFLRDAEGLREELAAYGEDRDVRSAQLRLHGLTAFPALMSGDIALARASVDAAVQIARGLDTPVELARALRTAALVQAHLGHEDQRLLMLHEAIRSLPPGSDRRLAVLLRVDAAATRVALGDRTVALAYLEDAETLLPPRTEREDADLKALVDVNVARVLRLGGDAEEARKRVTLAERLPGLPADHLYRAYLAVESFHCRHALGEPLQAASLVANAEAFLSRGLEALADDLLLLAARTTDDPTEALPFAERAAALATQVGDHDEELAALVLLVELLERGAAGRATAARKRLSDRTLARATALAAARATAEHLTLPFGADDHPTHADRAEGAELGRIVRAAVNDVAAIEPRVGVRMLASSADLPLADADEPRVDDAVRAVLRACRDSAVDGATLELRLVSDTPWVRLDLHVRVAEHTLVLPSSGEGLRVLERVRRVAHQAEAWATTRVDGAHPGVSIYWRARTSAEPSPWLRSEVTPTTRAVSTELDTLEALAKHSAGLALRRLQALRPRATEPHERARLEVLRAGTALNLRDLEAAEDALTAAAACIDALERPVDRVRAFRAAAAIARYRGIVAVADPLLDAASVVANALDSTAHEHARLGIVSDRSMLLIEAGNIEQARTLILQALAYGERVGRAASAQALLRTHVVFQCRLLGEYAAARHQLERALEEARAGVAECVLSTLTFEQLMLRLLHHEPVSADEIEALRSEAERQDDRTLAAGYMGAEAFRIAPVRPATAVALAVEAASTLAHAGERHEALRLLDLAAEWAALAGDLARSASLQAERRRVLERLPKPGEVAQLSWAPAFLAFAAKCAAQRHDNPMSTRPPVDGAAHTPGPLDLDALLRGARFTPEAVVEQARALRRDLARGPERTRVCLAAAAAAFNLGDVYGGLDAFAEVMERLDELASGDERARSLRMAARLLSDSGAEARARRWLLAVRRVADDEAGIEARAAIRISLSFTAFQAQQYTDAENWSNEGIALVESSTIPEREVLLEILRQNLSSALRGQARYSEALDVLRPLMVGEALDEASARRRLGVEAEQLKIQAYAGAPIDLQRIERVAVDARRSASAWIAGTLCGELAMLLQRHDPEAALGLAKDAVRDLRSCGQLARALPFARLSVTLHAKRGDPRGVARAERTLAALLARQHREQAFAAMMVARLEPVLRRLEAGVEEVTPR